MSAIAVSLLQVVLVGSIRDERQMTIPLLRVNYQMNRSGRTLEGTAIDGYGHCLLQSKMCQSGRDDPKCYDAKCFSEVVDVVPTRAVIVTNWFARTEGQF